VACGDTHPNVCAARRHGPTMTFAKESGCGAMRVRTNRRDGTAAAHADCLAATLAEPRSLLTVLGIES
jgi:hypothetical protein